MFEGLGDDYMLAATWLSQIDMLFKDTPVRWRSDLEQ
jgi:hypothetical protein